MRERAAADDRPVTRADTGKSRHLAHSPFRPKIFSHIIMIVTNGEFSNYFRKIAVVRKHNKRRTREKKPRTRMALLSLSSFEDIKSMRDGRAGGSSPAAAWLDKLNARPAQRKAAHLSSVDGRSRRADGLRASHEVTGPNFRYKRRRAIFPQTQLHRRRRHGSPGPIRRRSIPPPWGWERLL